MVSVRGPLLGTGEWTLESAAARSEEAPDTFMIPSAEARSTLVVGQGVKLVFWIQSPDEEISICERMWVLITEVADGGGYLGVLESTPLTVGGLRKGAQVRFGPEHVADIYDGPIG